jgi:hypothetical protein
VIASMLSVIVWNRLNIMSFHLIFGFWHSFIVKEKAGDTSAIYFSVLGYINLFLKRYVTLV